MTGWAGALTPYTPFDVAVLAALAVAAVTYVWGVLSMAIRTVIEVAEWAELHRTNRRQDARGWSGVARHLAAPWPTMLLRTAWMLLLVAPLWPGVALAQRAMERLRE